MKEITVRPVLTQEDNELFWQAKDRYLLTDIVPNADLGPPMTAEEQAHFQSAAYHQVIESLCNRETDRAFKVFFRQGDEAVGFCLYCTYLSEDGKCFILDFCVFSPFRGRGTGRQCFAALKGFTGSRGAAYYELNTHCRRSMRFWESLGFMYNGYDAHGSIRLILPPPDADVSCGELAEEDIWQIPALENSRRAELSEDFLTGEQQELLCGEIRKKTVLYYVVKRSTRVVGMCSVDTSSGEGALPYPPFVEPAFRRKGYARLLTGYLQKTGIL